MRRPLRLEQVESRALLAATPWGVEFPVPDVDGGNFQEVGDVATAGDGSFTAVWTDGGVVFARRYGPDNSPTGGGFPVHATGGSDNAKIATNRAGATVVVWEELNPDTLVDDIYFKLYGTTGAVIRTGKVNTTAGANYDPDVGIDGAGNFVVAWMRSSGGSNTIRFRRFSAAGAGIGNDAVVLGATHGAENKPAVGMADNGRFVVAWEDQDATTFKRNIRYTLYQADGATTVFDRAANSVGLGSVVGEFNPAVDMFDNGEFVVAWDQADNVAQTIQYRRFSVGGVGVGNQQAVPWGTYSERPDVAVGEDGGFVIAFEFYNQVTGNRSIYYQEFTAGNVPIGVTAPAHVDLSGAQNSPSVAKSGDNFVIYWQDIRDGDYDALARAFLGDEGRGRDGSDLFGFYAERGQLWQSSPLYGYQQPVLGKANLGGWSKTTNWRDVLLGDFDGDGTEEIAGRSEGSGKWFVVNDLPHMFGTFEWGVWAPGVNWTDVQVADVNGDGLDDLVGRIAGNGAWWVARSTGSSFVNEYWGRWSSTSNWSNVLVGDFDGNGMADLVGREHVRGEWWVSMSTGVRFVNERWGSWSTSVQWHDVQLGDFNGDGLSDVAGRASHNGAWWVAASNRFSFQSGSWGTAWSTSVAWKDVRVGDFDGDGWDDLAGRNATTGDWIVSQSTGSAFGKENWGRWSTSVAWKDVLVGDFNRDGRQDLIGRHATKGEWWAAISNGEEFRNYLWGEWSASVDWQFVQAGNVIINVM